VFQRNELTSGVWTCPTCSNSHSDAGDGHRVPVDLLDHHQFGVAKRLQDESRIDVVNQCMRVLTDAMVAAEEAAAGRCSSRLPPAQRCRHAGGG